MIVQVSDISVGYGNYDSLSMITSVAELYGLPGLILEPDQPDKPMQAQVNGIQVQRLWTSTFFRSKAGRVEFVSKAAKLLNEMQPKVLIIRCSWSIPVLLKLKKKPPLVIYHATESTLYYDDMDPALNRAAASMIDVVCFPEENRAARDVERCGFHRIPMAITYNCPISRREAEQVTPPEVRNGRVLYSGALDRHNTYIDYYAHEQMRAVPVDIYGYLGGSDVDGTRAVLESMQGASRYMGYVDTRVLEEARPNYAYSITIWNPRNENQQFACPCKFFESIAALVPPVTAPHPQCRLLTQRYGLGIVMDGWDFESFYASLRKAMHIFGTSSYNQMVDNCRKAVLSELNWDCQFAKVRQLLPAAV